MAIARREVAKTEITARRAPSVSDNAKVGDTTMVYLKICIKKPYKKNESQAAVRIRVFIARMDNMPTHKTKALRWTASKPEGSVGWSRLLIVKHCGR